METPAAPAPYGTPPQFVMMPIAQRNGLGVFGFFVSLVGLIIPTGVVALLGLILSLAAIGRSPRGFATSGVILGLLGTIFWLIVMVVAVVVGLVAALVGAVAAAGAFVLTQPEAIELTSDMVNTVLAVEEYERDNDRMPVGMSALALGAATSIDPWGQPYRFEVAEEDPGFDLVSGGPDGEFDTADDVRLSRLDEFWAQTLDGMEERMERLGQRFERINFEEYGSCRGESRRTVLTDAAKYEEKARQLLADSE